MLPGGISVSETHFVFLMFSLFIRSLFVHRPSVCPSGVKHHLLPNYMNNFHETSQECSSGWPLSNCSNNLIPLRTLVAVASEWGQNVQSLKIFSSESVGQITLSLNRNVLLKWLGDPLQKLFKPYWLVKKKIRQSGGTEKGAKWQKKNISSKPRKLFPLNFTGMFNLRASLKNVQRF